MAAGQRHLYEGALRNLLIDLRTTNEAGFRRRLGSFSAKRSELLKICSISSAPQRLIPDNSEIPAKLVILDQLVQELIVRRREKAVIWSFYPASLETIALRYAHHGVVRYDETVTDAGRREAVRLFEDDNDTMMFVADPSAAGGDLQLNRARYAIYESLSNQTMQYLQSLDRIHYYGRDHEVEVFVLLCDRSIEVMEFDGYEKLLGKGRPAQDWRHTAPAEPPTRDSYLKAAEKAVRALAMH